MTGKFMNLFLTFLLCQILFLQVRTKCASLNPQGEMTAANGHRWGFNRQRVRRQAPPHYQYPPYQPHPIPPPHPPMGIATHPEEHNYANLHAWTREINQRVSYLLQISDLSGKAVQ